MSGREGKRQGDRALGGGHSGHIELLLPTRPGAETTDARRALSAVYDLSPSSRKGQLVRAVEVQPAPPVLTLDAALRRQQPAGRAQGCLTVRPTPRLPRLATS